MRILFLSSVFDGGSPQSQRALAHALNLRGNDVRLLIDDQRSARLSRIVGERLADASVRFSHSRVMQVVAALPGKRPRLRDIDGLVHWTSPHPHNALRYVLDEFLPDVVVGSSVDRHSWRRALEICAAREIPTVIYFREVEALGHLEIKPRAANVVVANAKTLARAAEQRGHRCAFVPSVIDTSATRTSSTRTRALLVNLDPSRGLELAIDLATRHPEIPFTFQESWPLDDQQWSTLARRVEPLANIDLRRLREPGPDLYDEARVLLAPHRVDNRPRVIVEAQTNAIPAIVSNYPGLIEASGDAAIVLDEDDVDGWSAALRTLWEDHDAYDEVVAATEQAATRPELDPSYVAGEFEDLIRQLGVAPQTPS